jgi:hypothetical protein
MTAEQHFSLADVRRVNAEIESRDIVARWSERDDIIVRGPSIDAFLEADELFIGSDRVGRKNDSKIELEFPLTPLIYTLKLERGDMTLHDARGRVDLRLDSGDVHANGGSGQLTVSNGRGDVSVETYSGDVTINSGSGNRTLNDINGDLAVRAGKGDTKIERGSGNAIIANASGDLRISQRDLPELTVAQASGDVIIRGGRLGKTLIETASGDITSTAALSIATYDLTASSGDMTISVQRDLPARVDAATTRGSIDTDMPLVTIPQRGPRNPHGKRVVGSTGDAAERAEITLRTTSGDIRLLWSNEPVTAPAAPERPTQAEPTTPIPAPAPASAEAREDQATSQDLFADDDRRRVILSALADGSLSVEEASRLLDAMGGNTNGGR